MERLSPSGGLPSAVTRALAKQLVDVVTFCHKNHVVRPSVVMHACCCIALRRSYLSCTLACALRFGWGSTGLRGHVGV
jgi:hypothetical protein